MMSCICIIVQDYLSLFLYLKILTIVPEEIVVQNRRYLYKQRCIYAFPLEDAVNVCPVTA